MGGFFAYNRNAAIDESVAARVFERRGLDRIHRVECARFRFLYFPKHRDESLVTAEEGESILIASGTFIYRNLCRQESLRSALSDIRNHRFDDSQVFGAFALCCIENDSMTVMMDSAGLYHCFYVVDGSAISSSFTALAHAITGFQTLDHMAVLHNLVLGFSPADLTISSAVRRVTRQRAERIHWTYPCCVSYVKKPSIPELFGAHRWDHVVIQAEHLQGIYRNLRRALPLDAYLGVSGGYDSRLTAVLMQRAGFRIHGFSHRKPGLRSDETVARDIANLMNFPLTVVDTDGVNRRDSDALSHNMHAAFDWFDGRAHHAMEYLKYEYSMAYRQTVHPDSYPVMSGTGGEILRNHNYMPSGGSADLRTWMWYFGADYLSAASITCPEIRRRIEKFWETWIPETLQIEPSSRIRFLDMRRYYTDVWLPDWHGLRNSCENQFSTYLAPFADATVFQYAHGACRWIGCNGAFEADILSNLSPEIANRPSSYGYPLATLPFAARCRARLRCALPAGLKLLAGSLRIAYRTVPRLMDYPEIAQIPILKQTAQDMLDLKLPINLDRLAISREKRVLILSLGFALRRHASNSTLRVTDALKGTSA
ncbi:hypothetical protein JXA80_03500 [bacterium]|nr:hypothetical protein [candidate division CSSED10-310 bacterium]